MSSARFLTHLYQKASKSSIVYGLTVGNAFLRRTEKL